MEIRGEAWPFVHWEQSSCRRQGLVPIVGKMGRTKHLITTEASKFDSHERHALNIPVA